MTITVTPDPLTAGGEATVTVSGSSHGGETVTVDIDNGEGVTSAVDIDLDDSGTGSAPWGVPPSGWTTARFNYGSCAEVVRPITSPGAG